MQLSTKLNFFPGYAKPLIVSSLPLLHFLWDIMSRLLIDPLGRPAQPVLITIFKCDVRTTIPTFQNLVKKSRKTKQLSGENSDRYWRECKSGRGDH